MSTKAGVLGFAPKVIIKPIEPKTSPENEAKWTEAEVLKAFNVPPEVVNPEAAKYQKLWGMGDEYREVAPGELWATTFLQIARPDHDAEVIDFGCGTGRGAIHLALFGGMKATMLDFTTNCLDSFVADACVSQPERIKFVQHDLTKSSPLRATYGYCCDVMEHIPTEDVQTVLKNILECSHHVFFGISTEQDIKGALINEVLHLTVKPLDWWVEQIKQAGAVVHWAQAQGEACAVYCSSWKDAGELVKNGVLNVAEEILDQHVRQNVEAGWNNIRPYNTQPRELIILAGGPSMAGQLDKIKELRADRWELRDTEGVIFGHTAYSTESLAWQACDFFAGAKPGLKPHKMQGCGLVTVNGAYNWAIENGLVPSTQIVLDGREFNKRFVQPQVETCMYLMASQVDPKTLEGLPHERTWLWHSGISEENERFIREKTGEYFPVPGGSTVVLRAIPLLRMMGYTRFHMFGFDSCVMEGGTHHSYLQPENDNQMTIPISCGGREFQCVPWMVAQASEFREIVQFMGDAVELAVYGDGLIAHMLATGAEFAEEERISQPAQVTPEPIPEPVGST